MPYPFSPSTDFLDEPNVFASPPHGSRTTNQGSDDENSSQATPAIDYTRYTSHFGPLASTSSVNTTRHPAFGRQATSPRVTYEESWMRTSSPRLGSCSLPDYRFSTPHSHHYYLSRTPGQHPEIDLRKLASPSPLQAQPARTPLSFTSHTLPSMRFSPQLFLDAEEDDAFRFIPTPARTGWFDLEQQDMSPVERKAPVAPYTPCSKFSSSRSSAPKTPGSPVSSKLPIKGRTSFMETLLRAESPTPPAPDSTPPSGSDLSELSMLASSDPLSPSPFSSPLTPLSRLEDFSPRSNDFMFAEDDKPASPVFGRRRGKRSADPESPTPHARKKTRILTNGDRSVTRTSQGSSSSFRTSSSDAQSAVVKTYNGPSRTFPAQTPINIAFPSLYRRYPVSSYFQPGPEDPSTDTENENETETENENEIEASWITLGLKHPGGTYNPPRDRFDLYTPRFVKGIGKTKMGLCPICCEDVERGGSGDCAWFYMKTSAFKCYHMQYMHGISVSNALPFSPPIAFRVRERPEAGKNEKLALREGKCHKCKQWVAVEGVKDVEVKVKEIYWWKHAALCHHGTTVKGEKDYFFEDEMYASATNEEGS